MSAASNNREPSGGNASRDNARRPPAGSSITSWHDWDEISRYERALQLRQLVNDIFCDRVMGGLALLLIPILLLSDFASLSDWAVSFLTILDVAIWVFFVLEYICRLLVAENRWTFVASPWNILDLIIVGVPAVALVAGMGYGISRYLRILRAMQALQVLSRGGRTVKKALAEKPSGPRDEGPVPAMRIRAISLAAPAASVAGSLPVPDWQPVTIPDTATPIPRANQWVDFSGLTEAHLATLSRITAIPVYLLEAKLRARAYTRTETSAGITTVFVKIPKVSRKATGTPTYQISWDGILIAYDQNGAMTFSSLALPVLDRVAAAGVAEGIALTGPGILYLIVRDELGTIEDLILAAEEQLIHLEVQPMSHLPPNFLAMMYSDQKELSRIISGLLHTKTALEEICEKMGGESGETEEEGRLRSLIDRCSLLLDNGRHVSDSFAWMIDFYLNSSSFSMNHVMKILAVLTALTMVPAIVGGLLGMNLIGNPWPVTLLQMVTIVSLVMVLTAWVYYNLGWLKRD